MVFSGTVSGRGAVSSGIGARWWRAAMAGSFTIALGVGLLAPVTSAQEAPTEQTSVLAEPTVAAPEATPVTTADPVETTDAPPPEASADAETPTATGGGDAPADDTATAEPTVEPSAEPSAPASAAARSVAVAGDTAPKCDAGYVYAVTTDGAHDSVGQMIEIAPDGSARKIGDELVRSTTQSTSWNGLGLRGDGVALLFERQASRTAQMWSYTPSTGAWTRRPNAQFALTGDGAGRPDADGWTRGFQGYLLGGAVNPVTGTLVYGGYNSTDVAAPTNANTRFMLWEYDITTNSNRYLGYVPVTPGFDAGDLAFDAQGNMHVLSGKRDQTDVYFYSVQAADLYAAHGGAMSRSQTAPQRLPESNANGIAFDSDGHVYVSRDTSVYRGDMPGLNNFRLYNSAINGSIQSNDLAGCGTPPIIRVEKDVKGRAEPTDQFTLDLTQTSPVTTDIGEVTTSGPGTGIQHEIIGPFATMVGNRFTVSESAAGGADLANYRSDVACFADGSSTPFATRDRSASLDITYPSGARSVVCRVTNTPKPTLTLVKQIADDRENPLYDPAANPDQWLLKARKGDDSVEGATGAAEVTKKTVTAGEYTLSEKLDDAHKDKESGYEQLSLTCTVDEDYDGRDRKDLAVTDDKVTVPNSGAVECTFVNKTKPGAISWSKIADNGKPLAGSEWQVDGPAATTWHPRPDPVTADGGKGEFTIENLVWGDYTVTESKAPAGYEWDGAAPSFSVTIMPPDLTWDATSQGNGPITNDQVKPVTLPTAGGSGIRMYLTAGLLTLLLGAGGLLVANRRGHRRITG